MTLLSRRMAVATAGFGLAAAATGLLDQAHAASLSETYGKFTAGSTATVDHAEWSRMLAAYVVPGKDGLNRVNYAAWKAKDHAALKAYVKALGAVDTAKLDRPEQFAYWANVYNAVTIDVVLDKFPVKSIRDISLGGGLKTLVTGGPWQAKTFPIGADKLSLDDIEHEVMRKIFKDPRVHYSVNCASIGCPNLGTTAFTGANLEATLEKHARDFINSPHGFLLKDGKLKASSIYDWFRADFGGTVESVLAHAKKYAGPELMKTLEGRKTIDSYDYDWALNVATTASG